MFFYMKHRIIIFRTLRNLALGLILFIVVGNLTILGANVLLRATVESPPVPELTGVGNLAAVDGHLWRGAAPSNAGYRALAKHGVGTIVDLRAEKDVKVDEKLLDRLGIKRIELPMRDGQAPSRAQVRRFLDIVENSKRRVYVHCGAGVGRTGTMAASYLVATGKTDGTQAVARNLAIGPPSLEQITFAAQLAEGDVESPPAAVTLMSRIIDGPRRLWVNITHAYSD